MHRATNLREPFHEVCVLIGCRLDVKQHLSVYAYLNTMDAWFQIAICMCNCGCNIADAVLNHVCCTITNCIIRLFQLCLFESSHQKLKHQNPNLNLLATSYLVTNLTFIGLIAFMLCLFK
jgi:hypothetical protein